MDSEDINEQLNSKVTMELPSSAFISTVISKDERIFASFKFKDAGGYACRGSEEIKLDSIDNSINKIVHDIKLGDIAICILNDALKHKQYESGEPFSIAYKWGNGRYCSICNWDYNSIKIKLNSIALGNLIELANENNDSEIIDLINNTNWDNNIVSFIRNFNSADIHNKIGATLGDFDIEKLLTENMLSTEDVLNTIQKNANRQCMQKLKSVFVVKELGKFMAILDWVVDYNKCAINTSIMGDKVLDIENARFISDHNIYSRIEARSRLSDDVISKIFNSKV